MSSGDISGRPRGRANRKYFCRNERQGIEGLPEICPASDRVRNGNRCTVLVRGNGATLRVEDVEERRLAAECEETIDPQFAAVGRGRRLEGDDTAEAVGHHVNRTILCTTTRCPRFDSSPQAVLDFLLPVFVDEDVSDALRDIWDQSRSQKMIQGAERFAQDRARQRIRIMEQALNQGAAKTTVDLYLGSCITASGKAVADRLADGPQDRFAVDELQVGGPRQLSADGCLEARRVRPGGGSYRNVSGCRNRRHRRVRNGRSRVTKASRSPSIDELGIGRRIGLRERSSHGISHARDRIGYAIGRRAEIAPKHGNQVPRGVDATLEIHDQFVERIWIPVCDTVDDENWLSNLLPP